MICYTATAAEYEAREHPDALPLIVFGNLHAVVRYAERRAAAKGTGPYLIYEVSEAGERYLGEAG
jgi:hypothetical protein